MYWTKINKVKELKLLQTIQTITAIVSALLGVVLKETVTITNLIWKKDVAIWVQIVEFSTVTQVVAAFLCVIFTTLANSVAKGTWKAHNTVRKVCIQEKVDRKTIPPVPSTFSCIVSILARSVANRFGVLSIAIWIIDAKLSSGLAIAITPVVSTCLVVELCITVAITNPIGLVRVTVWIFSVKT